MRAPSSSMCVCVLVYADCLAKNLEFAHTMAHYGTPGPGRPNGKRKLLPAHAFDIFGVLVEGVACDELEGNCRYLCWNTSLDGSPFKPNLRKLQLKTL